MQQPPPGGPQFGAPPQSSSDMPTFRAIQPQPEAPSPISTRAPAGYEEFGGNFAEDEALAAAGEEGERGGASGNRWPRPETLALLRIRSEMDAAFREATLKGPLWEEVSRKLAELGYKRGAKKCKEKFENVHKYYKRTKDGRAGRQDGKSYRFFTELEALHGAAGSSSSSVPAKIAPTTPIAASATMVPPSPTPISAMAGRTIQVTPISAAVPALLFSPQPVRPALEAAPPITTTATTTTTGLQGISAIGVSFSSNSSSSGSYSDDEGTEDAAEASQRPKRRREGGHEGSRKKLMAFFEGMMKQVIDRQEAMQQKFLETIEKREQDRMIREEAWRRQEMVRLGREQELLAQERTMAANRDATLISYLQRLSGNQPIPVPAMQAPVVVPTTTSAPPPPSQPPSQSPKPPAVPAVVQPIQQQPPPPPPPPPPQQPARTQEQEQEHQSQASSALELMALSEQHEGGSGSGGFEGAASNRWPKAEVHELIRIRSGLESRYQEAGPKGPLWEEVSARMQKLGYNRNSKRCKEKWENINKYFKKVKESNKKRPEDAKTCPYFHQLDSLYRQKQLTGSSSAGGIPRQQTEISLNFNAPEPAEPLSVAAPADGQNKEKVGSSQGVQVQTSNGGLPPSFFEEGMKKPEDIVKELMKQRQQQAMTESYDNAEDSDTIDDDDDESEEDDEENGKLQYKIQFQRQNVGSNGDGGSRSNNAGSFLAIAQ